MRQEVTGGCATEEAREGVETLGRGPYTRARVWTSFPGGGDAESLVGMFPTSPTEA